MSYVFSQGLGSERSLTNSGGEEKLGRMARRQNDFDRVKIIIALAVTGVWIVSFLASLIPVLEYKPDPGVHAIMLIVAGAFFGSGFIKGDK